MDGQASENLAVVRGPEPSTSGKRLCRGVFDAEESSYCDGVECSSDAARQSPMTKHTNGSFDGLSRRREAMGLAHQPPKHGSKRARTQFFWIGNLGERAGEVGCRRVTHQKSMATYPIDGWSRFGVSRNGWRSRSVNIWKTVVRRRFLKPRRALTATSWSAQMTRRANPR